MHESLYTLSQLSPTHIHNMVTPVVAKKPVKESNIDVLIVGAGPAG